MMTRRFRKNCAVRHVAGPAGRYRADMKARPRKTSQPTMTSAVTAPAVMRAISFGVGGLSIFAVKDIKMKEAATRARLLLLVKATALGLVLPVNAGTDEVVDIPAQFRLYLLCCEALGFRRAHQVVSQLLDLGAATTRPQRLVGVNAVLKPEFNEFFRRRHQLRSILAATLRRRVAVPQVPIGTRRTSDRTSGGKYDSPDRAFLKLRSRPENYGLAKGTNPKIKKDHQLKLGIGGRVQPSSVLSSEDCALMNVLSNPDPKAGDVAGGFQS